MIVLLALGAVITGMIGCANGPKTGANQQTQRPENVDWKGANVGSEVPEWYKIAAGGVRGLLKSKPSFARQRKAACHQMRGSATG
ncbi:hypothetical protein AGMMS4952_02380 [Spirochaetia bacterium]|nr:hypothetical protein AGMMS4952_02380 [Spirochaetia bacterium]